MRRLRFVVACWFVGTAVSFAAEPQKQDHNAVVGAAKAAEGTVLAQKTCPVTGKPIQQDQFVEQDGLKVYFCCANCPAKFKESPMKYLPAVYRQVYPQSVQFKCPVMGGPVDGKTFIEYQGRRIGFCCDGCPSEFKANPAKFLAKMDAISTRQVHCPVTGKAINLKLKTEYQGKTVWFSSEDALTKFKAEPAKYAAALRPEAGVLARGATAEDDLFLTLASGRDSDTGKRKDLKSATYEGKTYLLRGDDGVKDFQADPAKYAKALDTEMKKRLPAEKDSTSNTGHGGMSHGQGEGAGHGAYHH